jgi:hypothetical protein
MSNSLFLCSLRLMRIPKVKTRQRKHLHRGGGSATMITRNNAEAEAPAAEVSMMKVLEPNAAEIPETVEIPHQTEV